MSSLTDSGFRAVCLSIEARADRRGPIQEDFGRYGISVEFFRAGPDGDDLDRKDTEPPPRIGYPAWVRRPNSWNAFCCFLQIIQKAKKEGVQNLLILEDDAFTTEDFLHVYLKARQDVEQADPDWQMLYLGANHTFARTEMVTRNLLRLNGSGCWHAVLLNRRAFDPVLNLPQTGPIDGVVGREMHPRGHCYAVWPNIVLTRPGYSYCEGRDVNYDEFWSNRGC